MTFVRGAGIAMAILFASTALAADLPVTFNNQVVRILQQHCQSCHRPENIAPFSLLTYNDALAHGNAIRSYVERRIMPPWKPVDPTGKFLRERQLTDTEIQTITKWVDDGMVEGAAADLPAPLNFPKEWTYSTPDAVVQPDAAYELSSTGGEVYRCFTMPVNSSTDLNVRGYEVLPGNREIVHHVLLFIDTSGVSAGLDAAEPGPGYNCFGGPGFIPTSALGGWVPGLTPEMFPLGLGVTVPANSRIVMQVHYSRHETHNHSHGSGSMEPDVTRVGMFLSPDKLQQVRYLPVVNPFFLIPANNSRYQVTATTIIPTAVELIAVSPHMHLLGREVLVEARLPGGRLEQLVHITDWDFNWQGTYTLRQPILLPAGTIVTSKAWYDNSPDNPRNPSNFLISVGWGERTIDEMCLTFLSVTAPGSRPMTVVPFSIGDRGGISVSGTGEGNTVTVGSARLTPRENELSAEGLAIFGLRQNGVLVTETAIPATLPLDRGRIFAETGEAARSGIAMANPNVESVTVTFTFVDSGGATVYTNSANIPGKTQIAKYLTESPFLGPRGFVGSFTFASSKPISVVALREVVNERGESLLTALPVTPLTPPDGSVGGSFNPLVFPHYADGQGWQTQILLVNPTEMTITGTYRFYHQNGNAVGTALPYTVAANSAARYQTPGTAQTVASGSVRFTPNTGTATPAGSLIFSFRSQGVRVTETGIAATGEAKAFRVYVESSEDGKVQSGVAIANPESNAATAVLELSNLDGSAAARTSISIPANGQLSTFLSQLPGFESLRLPFQGVLRISSTSNLTAIGLRLRYNERSDFLLATTPPVAETSGLPAGEKFFAHFVSGTGYTTQFIIFSSVNEPNGGTLSFYSSSGLPASLNVR